VDTVNRIRVALIDDQALYRQLIRESLNRDPEVNVVAEAENGLAGTKVVEEHRPDVVLMDISMPVMDGIEATKIILSNFPNTKVILLSMYSYESVTTASWESKPCHYIGKDRSFKDIIAAIKHVAKSN
jgi:DNA-binding NarL/FixJ family response regulator